MEEKDVALQVKNLSKRYRVNKPITTIREALAALGRKQANEWFWALDNISFKVNTKEVLGIIGENGSGKSTLLKIISNITKPTSGSVEIFGQLASILDVGTGFHPDFTGRENLYLRGQLYGLNKKVISSRIDEILVFSELENFIDVPVKYYSDGMFLRLAFSSIIHMDADILLLDEVLGVGDIRFQQKCYQKIHEIVDKGKTIIIVSHNPNELTEICTRYIHLEKGRIVNTESDIGALTNYIKNTITRANPGETKHSTINHDKSWEVLDTMPGTNIFRLLQISIYPKNTRELQLFTDQDLEIYIKFQKLQADNTLDIAFTISNELSNLFMACYSHRVNQYYNTSEPGIYTSKCIIPANWFNSGTFNINLYAVINRQEVHHALHNILTFQIESRLFFEHTSARLLQFPAPFTPALQWILSYNSGSNH